MKQAICFLFLVLSWKVIAAEADRSAPPANEYFVADYYGAPKDLSRKDLNDRVLLQRNFFINDVYAIKLTRSEFEEIANMNTSDQAAIRFANGKGIFFDTGLIPIFIDRRKAIMVTAKYDFGTLLSLDTIEEFLGREVRRHYARFTQL
jgi:hypothetical protein